MVKWIEQHQPLKHLILGSIPSQANSKTRKIVTHTLLLSIQKRSVRKDASLLIVSFVGALGGIPHHLFA